MRNLHKMTKKLTNEVIGLKNNVGESSSSRKPFKPWKKNNSNEMPPTLLKH